MTIKQESPYLSAIKKSLEENFQIQILEIKDLSHLHASHEGFSENGSHFKITIVSDDFVQMSRLSRERKINELLKKHYQSGLHSVTITAKTINEWHDRQKKH